MSSDLTTSYSRSNQTDATSDRKLSAEPSAPRSYIYAQRAGIGDTFGRFYARAKREGWRTYEIEASHNPHITAPAALLSILNQIAGA